MDSTTRHSRKLPTRRERWRSWYHLIAILTLVLASLACISSELHLEVTHQEGQVDNLEVQVQRTIQDSWVVAANQINQERAADFAAAGRTTDTEEQLPIVPEDFGDLLDADIYQDQGYAVTTTDRGFSAEKTIPLDQTVSTDDWKVKIIRNTEHPEKTTYRAKILLDLTEMESSLFELRNQALPAKPNLNPGSSSGSSGGGLSGLGGLFDGMSEDLQEEVAVELWYIQKAMQMSDPIEFTFSIELPGTVSLHELNGETKGTLDGNKVTLVLGESDLMAYSGQEVVFHVESVLLDCTKACSDVDHLLWGGDEKGLECECVCEKGFLVLAGEKACANCDLVCSLSDPNMETDLATCEVNKCGCSCMDGYEINNAGTRCIITADAEAEDNKLRDDGFPSKNAIKEVVNGLLQGMEGSDINKLPGWYLLTNVEREELLDLVETLGIVVDRSQLVTAQGSEIDVDNIFMRSNEDRRRLEDLEQKAIELAEKQIEDRRKVQKQIIWAIGGRWGLGQYLLNLPSYIFHTPRQLATEYVKGLLTKEAKKHILEESHGESPPNVPEAAAELIKQIPYLATNGCVDDYYRYKEYYQAECPNGCTGNNADQAHEAALKSLQTFLEKDAIYGAGRINWSKPGEAYDQAFLNLKKIGK